VLRLIQDPAWRLVADDQVALAAEGAVLRATAPAALRGMLEVRGLGILAGLPVAGHPPPPVRLAVHLAPREGVPRLPEPAEWSCAGCTVPALTLHGFDASAPARLALALDVLTGQRSLVAGALPPAGAVP